MNDQTNDDPKEMSAENKAENADYQSTDSPVVDEAETENDSASEEVSEVDLLAQLGTCSSNFLGEGSDSSLSGSEFVGQYDYGEIDCHHLLVARFNIGAANGQY